MQIVPASPPPARAAVIAHAQMYNTYVDHPRGWVTNHVLWRGEDVGAVNGYASLRDAVRAATELSRDSADDRARQGFTPAVAVFAEGDRFRTSRVQQSERVGDDVLRPRVPLNAGRTEIWTHKLQNVQLVDTALTAIVDDNQVKYLRAT